MARRVPVHLVPHLIAYNTDSVPPASPTSQNTPQRRTTPFLPVMRARLQPWTERKKRRSESLPPAPFGRSSITNGENETAKAVRVPLKVPRRVRWRRRRESDQPLCASPTIRAESDRNGGPRPAPRIQERDCHLYQRFRTIWNP